tara:strand:+ start:13897 stop:14043 length:147 start_codon:yes stop_codon:yes gene_type:complete
MLITFLALFAWVLNPKNKDKYDDAANMPLQEPDEPVLDDDSNNGRQQK